MQIDSVASTLATPTTAKADAAPKAKSGGESKFGPATTVSLSAEAQQALKAQGGESPAEVGQSSTQVAQQTSSIFG